MLTKNKLFERDSMFGCTRQPSSGQPQIRSYVAPCGQRAAILLPRSKVLRGKCDDGLNLISHTMRAPIVTVTTQRNSSSSPCHQFQGPHTKTLPYVSHFRAPSPGPACGTDTLIHYTMQGGVEVASMSWYRLGTQRRAAKGSRATAALDSG